MVNKMAKTTTNLGLPLDVVGHVQMQQSFKKAMFILDEAAVSGSTVFGPDPIASPDATDLATAQTLVNEIKDVLNTIFGNYDLVVKPK